MEEFQKRCLVQLIRWYKKYKGIDLTLDNVYIVWSCKSLQNYKCLAATDVEGDDIYAEYTYNGDKEELYEDVYVKITNTAYKDGDVNE